MYLGELVEYLLPDGQLMKIQDQECWRSVQHLYIEGACESRQLKRQLNYLHLLSMFFIAFGSVSQSVGHAP